MDEHVFGERAAHGCRRLVVEDPAAAVGPLVDEDLDELVRGGGRRVPQRPVVERQHVAFRVEDVVLRRHRRPAVDAGVRPVHAALGRGQLQGAHVKIRPPAPEGLVREQRLDEPRRVSLELRQFRLGVAFTDEQKVHFGFRRAALDQAADPAGLHGGRHVDEARCGIHISGPDVGEGPVLLTLAHDHPHRACGPGKPQRLVVRPMERPRLCRRFPLAVNRSKAARVQQVSGCRIPHLELVRAEVRRVDQLCAASRPGSIVDNAIERERLAGCGAARVKVVHPHRSLEGECPGRRLGERARPEPEHAEQEEAHRAFSIIPACASRSCSSQALVAKSAMGSSNA